MIISLLVAVLLTDVEWGANSPIGLILKSQVDESGHILLHSQGQTVGGTQLNNYSDGIQIPVYVLVFGLVGGYLRYLYDTARYEERRKKLEKETEQGMQGTHR